MKARLKTHPVTREVFEVGRRDLSGNSIPNHWWGMITLPSGHCDLLAIAILSEIIYWYRPTEIRCPESGETLGFTRKFDGPLYQRSYSSLAAKFKCSVRGVKAACYRLKALGLLDIVVKHGVRTNGGSVLNNVTYLVPRIDRLDDLAGSAPFGEVHGEGDTTVCADQTSAHHGVRLAHTSMSTQCTPRCATNTEIPCTEIPTEIPKSPPLTPPKGGEPVPANSEKAKRAKTDKPTPEQIIAMLPEKFATPEIKQALSEFLDMRQRTRRPVKTEYGARGIINSIVACGTPLLALAAIRQSVDHEWQGIFPPKSNGTQPAGNGTSQGGRASPIEILAAEKRIKQLEKLVQELDDDLYYVTRSNARPEQLKKLDELDRYREMLEKERRFVATGRTSELDGVEHDH